MAKKPNAFLDFKPSGRTPSKQRPGPKGFSKAATARINARVKRLGGNLANGPTPKQRVKRLRVTVAKVMGGGKKGGGGGGQ